MEREGISPIESCLNDGKDSVGQTKPRSWMVCNANGCYRPGGGEARPITRTRSLNPPQPMPNFGRKGHLLENETLCSYGGVLLTIVHQLDTKPTSIPSSPCRLLNEEILKTCHIAFNKRLSSSHVDPSEHFLAWAKPALNVLVIKKVLDQEVTRCFKELTRWLIEERKMVIYAESSAVNDPTVLKDEKFAAVRSKIFIFKEGEQLDDKIDFIVCMGGDGTLLHASSLFQFSCPPVMAFHLGSLGFLTSFRFQDFREKVTNILDGHACLTLRSRLQCDFIQRETDDKTKNKNSRYLVLNEVVVDRGPSSYLTNLEIYCNDHHITSVQGDGLIVSTPTGSTAYAVAAGASMVHPSVAAILVTPVCPHSLSFRPIILPAGVEVKIVVSSGSRSSAWTSFDGRKRQELRVGDSIHITTSIYPVPCVNSDNQISDWFGSLAECLHWNVRQRQRQLSITDCHV